MFHGGSRLLNLEKNRKKTQYSEFALNRSQKCPKTFWGDFFEIILCPVLHGGSSFWNFSKKMFSKFQKCPKSFPKTPNLFWTCFGANFSKYFMPSVPWRVEFSKTFEKNQKFSKFQKCRKSFPKNSKPVLNVFRGKFFEIFYAQFSMEGRVFENFQKNQRIFKVPKKPKIVTKSVQTCIELVLGQIFPKIFFAQCSMEARDF